MTKYLQHTKSGRLYVLTPELAERADMRPYGGPDPFKARRASRQVEPARSALPLHDEPQMDDADVQEAELKAAEELARETYQKLFDRAAPKNMKLETLQARIDLKTQELAEAQDPDLPTFGGN